MGKKSKKGRLTLELENGAYITKEEGQGDPDKVDGWMDMEGWKLDGWMDGQMEGWMDGWWGVSVATA